MSGSKSKTDEVLAHIQPDSGARMIIIVALLMILQLFAIFSYGGYFTGSLTVCVAVLWMLAGGVLWRSPLRRLTRLRVGVPLLALSGLWLWTGFSLIWSISPDLTWIEFGRTGGYLAAFLTGLVAASSRPTRRLAPLLFLFMAADAALYGLAAKALPQYVENADNLGRLSIPLGYANALGLLMAMAVPLALHFSSSRKERATLRLAASGALFLLLMALFFTLSRGAMLALITGLLVYFVASPLRQRAFLMLLAALLPVILVGRWSDSQPALLLNNSRLQDRVTAASSLRPLLFLGLAATMMALGLFLLIGWRMRFPAAAARASGFAMLSLTLATGFGSLMWFSSTHPSLKSWAQHKYDEMTLQPTGGAGVQRLFSVGSAVRIELWREAMANWRQEPITGSGGQTFPVVHLKTRAEGVPFVKQPHGLFFRLLTELGIVGFLLGAVFIGAVLTNAVRLLLLIRDRWRRGLAAALLSLMAVYLVHTSYDWDWNMFAVTMPFFVFSGLLSGWLNCARRAHFPHNNR